MKVSNIEKIHEFVSELESSCICENCHYRYDLKKLAKCPYCGSINNKNKNK